MYCTQADLERRFGTDELIQLSDRDGTGNVNTDVVDEAIADAGAEIDSYLEKRYGDQMPFSPPPSVLERIACNMARYHLYTHSKPEEVEQPYKAAVRFLERVATGDVMLTATEAGAGSTVGEAQFQGGPGQVFPGGNF